MLRGEILRNLRDQNEILEEFRKITGATFGNEIQEIRLIKDRTNEAIDKNKDFAFIEINTKKNAEKIMVLL
jgi:hypothetical protein